MAAAISEFLRLVWDQVGPIPTMVAILCFAGLAIFHLRSRIRILHDRLDLSEKRNAYSEEKRRDAEKEIEHLLLKSGPAKRRRS